MSGQLEIIEAAIERHISTTGGRYSLDLNVLLAELKALLVPDDDGMTNLRGFVVGLLDDVYPSVSYSGAPPGPSKAELRAGKVVGLRAWRDAVADEADWF